MVTFPETDLIALGGFGLLALPALPRALLTLSLVATAEFGAGKGCARACTSPDSACRLMR
eukprot:6968136-Pyramimonas_sp.AAC.2